MQWHNAMNGSLLLVKGWTCCCICYVLFVISSMVSHTNIAFGKTKIETKGMIKELFYSESCLHFKIFNFNNGYFTDVFGNLAPVGEAYWMKHCCEFIISITNCLILNIQETKNKTVTLAVSLFSKPFVSHLTSKKQNKNVVFTRGSKWI